MQDAEGEFVFESVIGSLLYSLNTANVQHEEKEANETNFGPEKKAKQNNKTSSLC